MTTDIASFKSIEYPEKNILGQHFWEKFQSLK